MNILHENMRRFGTKNLQEQTKFETIADVYKALKAGTVSIQDMAGLLKQADAPVISIDGSGIGLGNDLEAVIQSIFAAIKDINTLNKVFQILKRSVEDYIDDVGDELYDMNYHGATNVPTVRQSLQRLGYQIKQ